MDDLEDHVTKVSLDGLERQILSVLPEGISVSQEYDENSNLIAYEDALGNRTTYTYDSLDRLEFVDFPDGNRESFTYDLNLSCPQQCPHLFRWE